MKKLASAILLGTAAAALMAATPANSVDGSNRPYCKSFVNTCHGNHFEIDVGSVWTHDSGGTSDGIYADAYHDAADCGSYGMWVELPPEEDEFRPYVGKADLYSYENTALAHEIVLRVWRYESGNCTGSVVGYQSDFEWTSTSLVLTR